MEGENQLTSRSLHLRLRRRHYRIRVIAEQHAAETFAGQERRRSPLQPHRLERVAPLALERSDRKRRIARQFGDQSGQLRGEFGKAAGHDPGRVGSCPCTQIRANAPELLVNGLLVSSMRSRAQEGAGKGGHGRLRLRHRRHATADEELQREFRNRMAFHQPHRNAARQARVRAFRPDHRAFRGEWRREG